MQLPNLWVWAAHEEHVMAEKGTHHSVIFSLILNMGGRISTFQKKKSRSKIDNYGFSDKSRNTKSWVKSNTQIPGTCKSIETEIRFLKKIIVKSQDYFSGSEFHSLLISKQRGIVCWFSCIIFQRKVKKKGRPNPTRKPTHEFPLLENQQRMKFASRKKSQSNHRIFFPGSEFHSLLISRKRIFLYWISCRIQNAKIKDRKRDPSF